VHICSIKSINSSKDGPTATPRHSKLTRPLKCSTKSWPTYRLSKIVSRAGFCVFVQMIDTLTQRRQTDPNQRVTWFSQTQIIPSLRTKVQSFCTRNLVLNLLHRPIPSLISRCSSGGHRTNGRWNGVPGSCCKKLNGFLIRSSTSFGLSHASLCVIQRKFLSRSRSMWKFWLWKI